MAVTKWTLADGSGTHTFAINPSDKNGPAGEEDTEVAVGDAFVDEGGPMIAVLQTKAATPKFHVLILDEAEYKALWALYNTGGFLTLTDDLGATSTVYLTDIEAKRSRKFSHAWYHDLTVSYLVVAA
jgi:hypothetical protein